MSMFSEFKHRQQWEC